MKRSRFKQEQIIAILAEVKSGRTPKEVCAEHNISQPRLCRGKRKYGEMDISEARRLRALEEENTRLKKLVADLSVQNDILKEVNSNKW